jgi:formate hydrogenlyase transcriptional activator
VDTVDGDGRPAATFLAREHQGTANLIERAVIRSAGERLDVPVSEIDEGIGTKARGSQGTLEEAERAHILATLKETRWVLSGPLGAVRRLGLNRSTLQFRMKKLGIERPVLGD